MAYAVLRVVIWGLACLLAAGDAAGDDVAFRSVRCEGSYPRHLQGVCTNGRDAIYWSFTDVLVKTDTAGRVERRIDVANHHGDLCFRDGRVYVAVNLGEFNKPAGAADSWVFVYDADTLAEVARHAVPEVVHGAGGIAYGDGRFIVVGGLPGGSDANYLYEYDDQMTFRARHRLDSGYTLMGIQTVEFDGQSWWFGCYGAPKKLLKADTAFELEGKWDFDAALGIVAIGDGRFLVARGGRGEQGAHRGELLRATPDTQHGLKLHE